MISYKSDSKKTTYTICNYNIYQDTENGKSNTEITLKENRNNTEINQKEIRNKTEINQKETNNNDNNDNNENKNNPGGLSEPKLDNPQLAKLIKIYEGAGFGMINPYAAKILEDYLGEYGYEWVKEAIEIASEKGVRNLSYINGILKNMRSGKSQAKKKEKTYQKKSKYYKPVDHELSQDAKTFNDMLVNSFMENDI
ncbi:MAG: DnaD domain protein, partial [Bacteroidaceae bacterium]|nr:DnaD domain protein [Bacteroidaceae bacterium]